MYCHFYMLIIAANTLRFLYHKNSIIDFTFLNRRNPPIKKKNKNFIKFFLINKAEELAAMM